MKILSFIGKNDKEAENVCFAALNHRVKFQIEVCNFTNWLFEPCGKFILSLESNSK